MLRLCGSSLFKMGLSLSQAIGGIGTFFHDASPQVCLDYYRFIALIIEWHSQNGYPIRPIFEAVGQIFQELDDDHPYQTTLGIRLFFLLNRAGEDNQRYLRLAQLLGRRYPDMEMSKIISFVTGLHFLANPRFARNREIYVNSDWHYSLSLSLLSRLIFLPGLEKSPGHQKIILVTKWMFHSLYCTNILTRDKVK